MQVGQYLMFADYEELGPMAGLLVLGVYAVVLLVTLAFKVFRTWKTLLIYAVFSAVASLPAIFAYMQISQYSHVLKRPSIVNLLWWTAVFLVFVWVAPVIQYLFIWGRQLHRTKPRNLRSE